MILRSITMDRVLRFSSARLDVAALPRGIVALTGPNGAGKSTLLRAWRSVLDPEARRTLCAQAGTERRAAARVEFAAPGLGDVSVTWSLDGVRGSAEVSVLDSAGRPVLESTSVRAYDAWARLHLPAPELFLAALFAAQGEAGFLDATPAARKAVVLRALGIDRLEAVAAEARRRADEVRDGSVERRARAAAERAHEPIELLAAAVTSADAAIVAAERDHGAAAAKLEHLRASHDAAVLAYRDGAAAKERAQAARREREAAEAADGELARRHVAAQANLTALGDVDGAVANIGILRDEHEARRAAETQARESLASAEAASSSAARALLAAEDAAAGLEAQSGGIEAVRERLAQATVAAELLDGLRAALSAAAAARDEAHRAVADARADLDALTSRTIGGATERVEGLRSALGGVAAAPNLAAATGLAADGLAADDQRALGAVEHPVVVARKRAQIQELEHSETELARAWNIVSEALGEAERQSAGLPDLRAMEAAAASAGERLVVARQRVESVTAEAKQAREHVALRRTYLAECTEAARAARARMIELEAVAARAALASSLRVDLAALAARLEQSGARLTAAICAEALAPMPADTPPPPPDIAAAQARAAAAEAHVGAQRQVLARAEAALESAQAAEARAEAIDTEIRAQDALLADLSAAADAVGQKGLVALLVDAAGPELSTLATTLLRESYGPRWSVTIETTRPSADGKREIEDCVVSVLDSIDGGRRDGREWSGGQRVILGEAVSLALATIAIRRLGMPGCTLVRDESGAALDAENAPRYVSMLRRAAELAGAARVILVTHDPSVPSLCDARVRVEAGTIRVEE